jgi:ABC-2 type transport system ATP-binding protein
MPDFSAPPGSLPAPSPAPPPISVAGLAKSYGAVQAVRDVSFHVEHGSIFGLIGPDGAGKTTILRTVVSLLSFDSGQVLFCGQAVDKNPAYVRSRIGYMPQRFSLYQDLSVAENLRFFGDLFGVPRRELAGRLARLYEFSGLSPFKSRRAGALSGGMKQKLALSCMLVHSPEVLVLDEPTFGVDPVSRGELWDILKALRDQGSAVLVSTAYMDEALLCDRVALLFEGRILAEESPGELAGQYGEPLYLVETPVAHRVHAELERSRLCGQCHLFGDGVHVTLGPGVTATQVAELLAASGVQSQPPRPISPGLEDLFLKLMRGPPHG